MLVTVTEANAWEHERWTYILDVEKLGAPTLNELISFCRLATEEAKKMKDAVMADPNHPWVTDMFGRQLYKLYAASAYHLRFYDSMEWNEERGYPILVEGRRRLNMNSYNRNGYKSGGDCTDERLSVARLHSAVVQLQKNGENKLYKDFEGLFLKKKVKA